MFPQSVRIKERTLKKTTKKLKADWTDQAVLGKFLRFLWSHLVLFHAPTGGHCSEVVIVGGTFHYYTVYRVVMVKSLL